MINTHPNKKRIAIVLLFIAVMLFISSCSGSAGTVSPTSEKTPMTEEPTPSITKTPGLTPSPSEETQMPDITSEPTPGNTADVTETATPVDSATPTPSEVPPFTYDYDSYEGPVTIGEEQYYVVFKNGTLNLADCETLETVYSVPEGKPADMALFLSTLSLVDLNFDDHPDLSFRVDKSGKRVCYVTYVIKNPDDENAEEQTFLAKDVRLSNLIDLTKNARSEMLFAKKAENDTVFTTFTYIDGVLTEGEVINETFEWTPEKIAEALFGEGTPVEEGPEYTIRGTSAESRTIFGAITVAFDQYGNYYIKDTPSSPFCRLMLNPNGSWSKSEKVG